MKRINKCKTEAEKYIQEINDGLDVEKNVTRLRNIVKAFHRQAMSWSAEYKLDIESLLSHKEKENE